MNFFYAQNSSGEYLCGIDENDEAIYDSDYHKALWSWNNDRISNYVSDNSLDDATVQSADSGGNNPPQKPPF